MSSRAQNAIFIKYTTTAPADTEYLHHISLPCELTAQPSSVHTVPGVLCFKYWKQHF